MAIGHSRASAPGTPLLGQQTVGRGGARDRACTDIVAKAADATRPTRAEEILLRYAAIVESSDDAIIAKTLDGVISAWNPAAERLFGYTQYEAIGQPITMIIPPDLHEEEYEILSRLRAGERIDHYETVRVTKAGQCIDVSLTISPLRDAAGRIIGCSKIARDVTKAKRAAVNLRRSEQRLTREVAGAKTLQSISTRLISESKSGTLYDQVLGAAMELMASDAACLQMLAAEDTSLRLLAWTNFHPDCVPFWTRVAAGAGSTCSKALSDNQRVVVTDIEACEFMAGTQEQLEYRRAGVRGVQSTPLRSRTGRLLGMLSTHWRTPHTPTEDEFRFFDVLARQAADLIERTLAEEALRESEERFRLIANTAPVMIWMSGTDNEITISIRPGSITRDDHRMQRWKSYRQWFSTQTKRSDAARCTRRPSSSESLFSSSIGSGATTANIDGWRQRVCRDTRETGRLLVTSARASTSPSGSWRKRPLGQKLIQCWRSDCQQIQTQPSERKASWMSARLS
jgi:PAS domain S-box-containing protein